MNTESSKKSHGKKRYLLFAGMVLVLAVPVGMYLLRPSPRNIREAISETLDVPVEQLVVNFPPAEGRYPTCTFARLPNGRLVPFRTSVRPDSVSPITWELENALLGSYGANWAASGVFSVDTDASEGITIHVRLTEGRIFEADSQTLRKLLKDSEIVDAVKNREVDLVFVNRAYEAIPMLRIEKKQTATSEQWNSVKESGVRSGATLNSDGTLELKASEPVIIAFETVSLEELSTHMSDGDTQMIATPILHTEFASSTKGAVQPSSDVGFATAFVTDYPSKSFGNLPSARTSAILVNDALQRFGAEDILGADGRASIQSTSDLKDRLSAAIARAEQKGLKALVFYSACHSIAVDNGLLYLVTSEFVGDLEQEIESAQQHSFLMGPLMQGDDMASTRELMIADGTPASADVPGMVPLHELHDLAQETDVAVSLIVDGCYRSETVERLRASLKLTGFGDYYGADDSIHDVMESYGAALELFGKSPHLRSATPIILAARPGSLALVESDPRESWLIVSAGGPRRFSPGVGPLAQRIHRLEQRRLFIESFETWADVFRLLTDSKRGVGEISTTGSISWSDYSEFEKLSLGKVTPK